MRPIRILLATAATMASLARLASAQPTGVIGYEATSIGVLEGHQSSSVKKIDEFARMTGTVGNVPSVSVVWINGELHRVPPPPGAESASASAISPTTGYIVGTCLVNGQSRPAAWRIGGGSAILERLPGSQTACLLQDVNDSGWISGWCDFPNRAALWRRLDPPIDLGTLGGRGLETASGINAHGEIVGSSNNAQSITRPYLWRNGLMIDIGGEPANASGYAYGINDRTEVVGEAPTRRVAFHWFQGQITDLLEPHPVGGVPKAQAANTLGLVVGSATNRENSGPAGVVWDRRQEFQPIDLNDHVPLHPGLTLVEAKDVNDAGQIAAYGKLANGQGRGFLVTPYLFEMSDPVPGRAGTMNVITITGLAPNQRVHLVWGTREGAQKIHSGCPGGTLLIRDPQALPAVRADANGVATINVNVPLIARGRTVRLQAVAPIECQISHTVTWTFE